MTDSEASFAACVLLIAAIFALAASSKTKYLVGAIVLTIFAIALSPRTWSADLLVGHVTQHFDDCLGDTGKTDCIEPNDQQRLIGIASREWAVLYIPENSASRKSFLILRKFSTDWGPYLRPYVSIGLSTGYEGIALQDFGGITPTGYLSLDIHPRSDRFGVLINWLPESFIGIGPRFKF